jgi:MFS family permease
MQLIRGPRAILALLTALNLLNYLDRMVLSAVLHHVRDDLSLSKLAAGWAATVFLIGYFATSPIFGSMADRAGTGGRKVLITFGIAVWSLATIATGLVHSTAGLFAARAFVGVGEASYATIAPTLIDEFAPAERKGRWLAVFYTAMPVGSALGYVVGGAVEAATHDWRMAFFVAGGPGLVLALLCLLIAEPERAASRQRPEILRTARDLAAIPAYRNVVLGYCAYTFALGGFAYWAPFYLQVRYGLEEGRASMLFGAVVVVSGTIGTLLGGRIADRRLRGETDDASATRAAVWVCALSAGLGAPLALAAVLAPSAAGFFALVLPCQIALFLSSGPVNVAILRSVPAGLRASAMALSIFAIHVGGDLWSPPLIGMVADHAPMAWAMLAAPVVFALGAFIWWRGAQLRPIASG